MQGIAQGFLTSNEFVSAMGGTPSTYAGNAAYLASLSPSAFLTALYENVLGRAPDAPGQAYWEGQLAGGESKANVLISFATSTENGSGNTIYDGAGSDILVINGSGNNLIMGKGTDRVYLLGGSNTLVSGFTPSKGSGLDVANTTNAPSIQVLTGSSTNPVNGADLHFGSTNYVINVGTVAAADAATAATAINKAYTVGDTAGEHVTFLAQDASGDTLVWFWGSTAGVSNGVIPAGSLTNTADVSHSHAVTAAELTLIATVVGVTPSSFSAADLA